MKIIELASDSYPFVKYGGLEKVVFNLSTNFKERGHDVTLVTCTNSREKTDFATFRVPDVKMSKIRGFIFSIISSVYVLVRKMQRDVDIVHMHGAGGTNFLNILCRLLGIPVVLTVHGKVVRKRELGIWLKHFDAITCVSNETKNETERIVNKKCIVIHNGINLKSFRFSKNEVNEARKWLERRFGKGQKILYVGRMLKRKGVLDLYKISKGIDSCIIMVGTGELEGRMRKLSEKLKNLKALGFVPDQELRKFYLGCDACIIPSHFEPFGIVVLEAMAFGKPVIASDVGGIKDIIKNNEGVLVKPGDVQGFASAISSLKCKRLRNELSRRSLSRVRDFSWERIAGQYLKVFYRFSRN